jgi:hypothetical protein
LAMETRHDGRLRSDFTRIAAPMGLRLDAPRAPVALQQALDKAQADAKHPRELPLGAFSSFIGTHHLQPKVSRIWPHRAVLLLVFLAQHCAKSK